MAWTSPKTWTAGFLVGETDLNTHLRDNLNALKEPPFQQIITGSAGNLSTTATSAVPISTADLGITLTTFGANVHVHFQGFVSAGAADIVHVGLTYDTTALNPPTGLFVTKVALAQAFYDVWVTGLATGSHTFQPTWCVEAGGQTAILVLSTAPAIFWAREG
jgi:hypothetical protein